MRIHLIKKQTIEDYMDKNVRSRSSFRHWLSAVKFANWDQPADIKKTFCTADILGNDSNREVFNIGGNDYRMICKYFFGVNQAHLFICWIVTHADYDKLCQKGNQYSVNAY